MSEEFPLSSLYLTPRAAKRAHAAGVIAFWANREHMEQIREYLHSAFPEIGPKASLDELTIVMR